MKPPLLRVPRYFCGCCGGRLMHNDDLWCHNCEPHVLPDGPIWDRTYEAQHKEPCPFIEQEFA